MSTGPHKGGPATGQVTDQSTSGPRRIDFDDVLSALQHLTDNDRPRILRFVAASLDGNLELPDYTRSWIRAQLRDLADLLDRP